MPPQNTKYNPPAGRYTLTLDWDVEVVRQGLGALVQVLIELEISAIIAAAPHERSSRRRTYRNGYRRRLLFTSVGQITCHIPKLRKGSYYPSFLEGFDQHETLLLQSLQDMLEQGVNFNAFQTLISRLGIDSITPDLLADAVEQFYDFARHDRRAQYLSPAPEPVLRQAVAISTQRIDVSITDDMLPYPRSQLIIESFMLLDESLNVLLRVRQALSDSVDAIGLAA